MTSKAKIAAARANGRKSRGPRTAQGKATSARNAYRHGFAAITTKRPEHFAEIEADARAICEGTSDPFLYEQALIIAENGLVRRCVEAEWMATIERHRDPTVTPLASGDLGFARAKATLARAKLTYEVLLKREAQAAVAENVEATGEPNSTAPNKRERATTQHLGQVKPMLDRDEFAAMCAAMPDLARLERYRRRAFSCERRAVRRFYEIQSACKEGD